MKAVKYLVGIVAVCITFTNVNAQQTDAFASERAILFAGNFVKTFHANNLDEYTNLSYPGVISYYGGNKNFREYLERARTFGNTDSLENVSLVQMLNNTAECQCVIRKTSVTFIDGKKAHIISYLVGQSKDKGLNWKFFDVASNSVKNVVYIMPDIFDALSIPQREVIFEDNTFAGKL
jgi:hypothetical protein